MMRIQVTKDKNDRIYFYIRDIKEHVPTLNQCIKLYEWGYGDIFQENNALTESRFDDEFLVADYSISDFIGIIKEAFKDENGV